MIKNKYGNVDAKYFGVDGPKYCLSHKKREDKNSDNIKGGEIKYGITKYGFTKRVDTKGGNTKCGDITFSSGDKTLGLLYKY